MINNKITLNVYEDRFSKKKLSTQLLYGDSFKIIKTFKNYLKIKSLFDGYVGYISKKKFPKKTINTHKVSVLKANLYSKPNKKFKLKKLISFCSYIAIIDSKNGFYKFDKYWIKKNAISPIKDKIKIFNKIEIFKGVKYKWGGNSYKGIDCSALVQIFYKFNNKFCPRDTKDQVKYFKNINKIKKFKKNDLIYWKGHVAICLSSSYLIHAYGPKKKVIIMNIRKTISEIKNKSHLNMLSLKNTNDI